jgi:hypothetical protein
MVEALSLSFGSVAQRPMHGRNPKNVVNGAIVTQFRRHVRFSEEQAYIGQTFGDVLPIFS